jgi:hypothetical protein
VHHNRFQAVNFQATFILSLRGKTSGVIQSVIKLALMGFRPAATGLFMKHSAYAVVKAIEAASGKALLAKHRDMLGAMSTR